MADRPTARVRVKRLPYPVEKAVVIRGVVVVMADMPLGDNRERNVFGMKRDGTLIWRVSGPPGGGAVYFLDIYMDKKGSLIGRTTGGRMYRIDAGDGKLSMVK